MKSRVFAVIRFLLLAGILAAPALAQPALLGLRSPATPSETQGGAKGLPTAVAANSQSEYPGNPVPPATLILPAGTIITIATSELLSSNTQHPGDNFIAELQQPLVVDGWVVARPGQTVMGRIAEAKKAGRVKGTSKLSLELQHIILVDGKQAAVQSELVENSGPTSHGRDLLGVAITTGVGAAIGSVCGGKGAAIGAGVGAAAGITGVLLTRGEKTEISPENLLTFRLSSPLNVATDQTPHSFWQVTPDDYLRPDGTSAGSHGPPGPVVNSHPAPVPLVVWPEIQGLSVGRPGHRECGS